MTMRYGPDIRSGGIICYAFLAGWEIERPAKRPPSLPPGTPGGTTVPRAFRFRGHADEATRSVPRAAVSPASAAGLALLCRAPHRRAQVLRRRARLGGQSRIRTPLAETAQADPRSRSDLPDLWRAGVDRRGSHRPAPPRRPGHRGQPARPLRVVSRSQDGDRRRPVVAARTRRVGGIESLAALPTRPVGWARKNSRELNPGG